MINLLLCGDLHYTERNPVSRKDDYTQALYNKIVEIGELAIKHQADGIVFTGDFFDKKRPTFHETRSLVKLLADLPVKVYGIYGNHDTFNLEGAKRRACGLLEASETVRILDNDPVVFNDDRLILSGSSYQLNKACLPTKSKKGWCRIHITHLDMFLAKPNRPIPYIPVEKFRRVKCDLLFNGHIHHDAAGPMVELDTGLKIYNLGSIGRPRRDDIGTPSILKVTVAQGKIRHEKIIELEQARPHKEVFIKQVGKKKDNSVDHILEYAKSLARKGQEGHRINVKNVLRKLAKKQKSPAALKLALEYLEEV